MYSYLFRPAERILDRLGFGGKVLLVGLLIALPLGYVTLFTERKLAADIEFTSRERVGLQFVPPAMALIQNVQKHRGTSQQALAGDTAAAERLPALQAEADAAVAALDDLDGRHGAALKTGEAWSAVKSAWDAIKSHGTDMTPEASFKAHTDLIAAVLGLVSLAADNSNLTLDPEFDTYYLMDLTTAALPAQLEFLGQMRALATGVATRGAVTEAEKLRLIGLEARSETMEERLRGDVEKAFAADADLEGTLGEALKSVDGPTTAFLDLVRRDLIEASTVTVSGQEVFDAATGAIDAGFGLETLATAALDDRLKDRVSRARTAKTRILGLVAAAIALALYAFLAFTATVRRSLRALETASRRIAEGDLTLDDVGVRSHDEIGRVARVFGEMARDLRSMMGKIRETSDRLARSSQDLTAAADQAAGATAQIADAIQQVAEGAGQQASGAAETVQVMEQLRNAIDQIAEGAERQFQDVRNTSRIMEEMARAIQEVSRVAQEVVQVADEAPASARSGGDAVKKTLEGMHRIRAASNDAAARVRELGEHSQHIGEIVQLISDIADQTNLLALNAAIEAARAGEHGKGFAVVADEVRKLAERSGRASQEIAALVGTIQRGVQASIEAMNTGSHEVGEGAQLAGATGLALKQILAAMERTNEKAQAIFAAAVEVTASADEVVSAVKKVSEVTQQNTAATEEMTAGSMQVARSVQQVAAVSEETAASAEEVSASAEEVNAATEEIGASARELQHLAENLEQLVGRFKL